MGAWTHVCWLTHVMAAVILDRVTYGCRARENNMDKEANENKMDKEATCVVSKGWGSLSQCNWVQQARSLERQLPVPPKFWKLMKRNFIFPKKNGLRRGLCRSALKLLWHNKKKGCCWWHVQNLTISNADFGFIFVKYKVLVTILTKIKMIKQER